MLSFIQLLQVFCVSVVHWEAFKSSLFFSSIPFSFVRLELLLFELQKKTESCRGSEKISFLGISDSIQHSTTFAICCRDFVDFFWLIFVAIFRRYSNESQWESTAEQLKCRGNRSGTWMKFYSENIYVGNYEMNRRNFSLFLASTTQFLSCFCCWLSSIGINAGTLQSPQSIAWLGWERKIMFDDLQRLNVNIELVNWEWNHRTLSDILDEGSLRHRRNFSTVYGRGRLHMFSKRNFLCEKKSNVGLSSSQQQLERGAERWEEVWRKKEKKSRSR